MVKSCFFVRVIEDLVFQFFDIYVCVCVCVCIFIILIRGFSIWVSTFCILKYPHTNS